VQSSSSVINQVGGSPVSEEHVIKISVNKYKIPDMRGSDEFNKITEDMVDFLNKFCPDMFKDGDVVPHHEAAKAYKDEIDSLAFFKNPKDFNRLLIDCYEGHPELHVPSDANTELELMKIGHLCSRFINFLGEFDKTISDLMKADDEESTSILLLLKSDALYNKWKSYADKSGIFYNTSDGQYSTGRSL